MKRILTFDVLRGIAIFGVVVIHLFAFLLDFPWPDANDLRDVSPGRVIVFAAIQYFSGWAALFLLISGAVNTYVYARRIRMGVKPSNLQKKMIAAGLALLLMAYATEILFHYQGLIPGYLYNQLIEGGDTDFDLGHTLLVRWLRVETIRMIAFGQLAIAIIVPLLYSKSSQDRQNRIVFMLLAMAFLSNLLTPLLRLSFSHYATGWSNDYQYTGINALFVQTFFSQLAGEAEPIFPYVSVALVGSAIGLLLSTNERPRFLLRSLLIGGIMLKGIALTLHILGYAIFPFRRYNQVWFIFTFGGQLILLALFLVTTEYQGNLNLMKRLTRPFRRWGMISLTIYTFHIFGIALLLPLAYLDWIELKPQSYTLLETILILVIVIIIFDLLIRLWSLYDFKWSLEWILLRMSSKNQEKLSKNLSRDSVLDEADFITLKAKVTSRTVNERHTANEGHKMSN